MTLRYWNNFYAGLNPDNDIPYERWLHKLIAPRLLSKSAPQALDLGCGAGLDSAELRKLGFDVFSVDISEQALLKARSFGHITNPCVADAEVFAQSLNLSQFDLILANLSLHYMPHENLRLTLSSLLRALRSGGQLIARFNHQSDINFGADKADEHGYFRRLEQGEETLKVFYTEKRLRENCESVLAQLGEDAKSYRSYSIDEANCENFGRPKRLLSLVWERV